MLQFCKRILESADIDSGSVRVGFMVYSDEVTVAFHLNNYTTKADVMQDIFN